MNQTPAPAGHGVRGLAGRLGPFRHRPFAIYWVGGLISNLGSWLQTVAGSIFVYQLTGSAFAVGILNFAGFLPIFLFSIAGGVVSDRFDRRTVVIVTHIASGILAAGLAILSFLGVAQEIHLIAVFFALNTTYAIAKPSLIAILPGLVPRDEITDAVGLNTLQFILGQITGPLIAALVMATAGAPWAFTINAVTYLGPILSMVYLQRHDLGARSAGTVRDAGRRISTSGGSYVREHSWVIALLIGIVSTSAPLEVIRTLSPAIVVEGLGQPDSAAGVVVAAQSIGSALALIAFVPMRRRNLSRTMVPLGLILQSIGLVVTALAPTLAIVLVAVGLVGFGFSLCFPVLTGTLQLEVPDVVRGRVMAFHQTAHLGNRPISALLVGSLATMVGAQPAVIAGALLAPIGLIATRRAWQALAARSEGADENDDPVSDQQPAATAAQ